MSVAVEIQVLVVDDNAELAEQARDALENMDSLGGGATVSVTVETSFENALDRLGKGRFDALVLDIRDDNSDEGDDVDAKLPGLKVFEEVRATQFVPIVFFSLLPHLAAAGEGPFVTVVDKNHPESLTALRKAVAAVVESGLPTMYRALLTHVEGVTRDFMTNFVEPHWKDLSDPARKGDLAHLLLRRLARTLDDGAGDLRVLLAGGGPVEEERVHPMRFYLVPPAGERTLGDIVKVDRPGADQAAVRTTWHVVLTPACDLVESHGRTAKAEFVTLVECVLLETRPEFEAWKNADGSAPSRKALQSLMLDNPQSGQKERFMFLPGAWRIPDVLVDFQRITSEALDTVRGYERVATLDSPYAEALIVRYNRYAGRVGTPDLDADLRLDELTD